MNQSKIPVRSFQQLYALQPKGNIDLSLSENPLGCSPRVVRTFRKLRVNFNHYPDPNAQTLRKALAQFLNCQAENIFIGNGSESIIPAVCRMFIKPGKEVLVPQLTFPMFAISSLLVGAKVKEAPMDKKFGIDLEQMRKMITKRTKMIFVCNPNNPTGAVISKLKLLTFLKQIPQGIFVVVDEANIEFGGQSILPEALNFKNVLVLRTFSKAFGLAALRVGCVVGENSLIQKLKEETPIFPITSISQQLAEIALQDRRFLQKTKSFINQQRKFLTQELTQLGFTVFPSQANNLFVKLPKNIKPFVFLNFLEKESISLVKGESFSGLDNRFFRVSPRSVATNRKFIAAMKKLF